MWSLWIRELRHYPDKFERKDVIRRWVATRRPPSQSRTVWAVAIVVMVVLSRVLIVLVDLLAVWGVLVWDAVFVLLVIVFRVVYYRLGGTRFRQFVRNDLLSMRICWRCGYDLTGNETGRCSECGQSGVNVIAEY